MKEKVHMLRRICVAAQLAFALAALAAAIVLDGVGMVALLSLSYFAFGVRVGDGKEGGENG